MLRIVHGTYQVLKKELVVITNSSSSCSQRAGTRDFNKCL